MASENLNQSSVALTPVEATDYAESVAAYKAQKRPFLSFLSGISAGACIALAFVFYTTTQTASAGAPWGLTKLVGGLVFSLGVIMVVILGSELFTSSTLTLVARVGGKITTSQMIRNWIVVYLGNFVGGLFIAAVIWFGGQTMVANGQWGLTILATNWCGSNEICRLRSLSFHCEEFDSSNVRKHCGWCGLYRLIPTLFNQSSLMY